MRKAWILLGRLSFWCSWPALWLYLRFSHRTRVIVHYDGKVLVLKNWLGDGKWALPGGGLHHGEDARRGAVREVREETGIQLHPEELINQGSFRYRDKGFRFRYDLFSAKQRTAAPTTNQRLEVIAIAWLTPTELTLATTTKEVVKNVQVWLAQDALLQ